MQVFAGFAGLAGLADLAGFVGFAGFAGAAGVGLYKRCRLFAAPNQKHQAKQPVLR